ncbi:MAG: M20 family metallopeptidase [Flavobacteriales bacterium]|nr:M20 family metallopeptidase [Flavobacteriales bacterium]
MQRSIQKIKELVKKELALVIEIRRYLHQNPELSFEEYKTSEYIQGLLKKWNIPFQAGYVNTGIKVLLTSGEGTQNLALRADIDALPIQEQNEVAYCSTEPNTMHACGHDAHTASLLVVLKILNENKDLWEGKLTAIFQPGEEVLPGGAKLMIDESIFEPELPQAIFGQHVFPDLPAGKIGFRSGLYMASCDEIHLSFKGKGGHAALPHTHQDTILASAEFITHAQKIVSRKISPYAPVVLSFGYIQGLGATNVIPDEVHLKGTLRCLDEEWRAVAHQELRKIIDATCLAHDCSADLDLKLGYPSLKNDPDLTKLLRKSAEEYLGKENVVELGMRMTAEDFAYYSQMMPACFYRFGTAEPGKENEKKLHHPLFDIDESSLETSVGMMTYLALNYFNSEEK